MKKRIFIIVCLLFVAFLSIRKTYAYYVDQVVAKAKLNVADWVIRLNSTDVTLEENNDFTIEDINWNVYKTENGLDSSNGAFAPGMDGEFSIALDASESLVALEYYLDIDMSLIDNKNIVVSDVSVDNGTIELVDGLYYGKLDLNNVISDSIVLIDVKIEWIDDEGNNEEDSKLGNVANNSIVVPVNVVINQFVE